MTTLIEAARQALEALLDPWSAGPEGVAEAITALRTAIEEAERQEPVAWAGYNLDDMCEAFDRVIEEHHQRKNPFHDPVNKDAMIALRILRGFVPHMKRYTTPPAAQPAPVQEPVLWRDELMCLLARIHRDGGHYTAKHGIRKSLDEADIKISEMNAANREWVGLTDREADKIYKDASTFGEMLQMVEAKLKEKHHG